MTWKLSGWQDFVLKMSWAQISVPKPAVPIDDFCGFLQPQQTVAGIELQIGSRISLPRLFRSIIHPIIVPLTTPYNVTPLQGTDLYYLFVCFMLVSFLPYSSTLKTEEICSFENSVDFQRNTRRYFTEDGDLDLPCLYACVVKIIL
jgi:hypothetical protein